MEGKKLLELYLHIGPMLPKIMNMEDNVIIWATDTKKYILMHTPNSKEWECFNAKVGEPIRAGIGPIVLKTQKSCHAVIPEDVFGKPIRASAYPIIENNEILGVIGISFGMEFQKNIAEIASQLSKMSTQLYYK